MAYKIPSLVEKQLNELNKFLNIMPSQLILNGLDYKQTDNIVRLMKELLCESERCILHLIKNTVTSPEKIVGDVFEQCKKAMQSIDSKYKR